MLLSYKEVSMAKQPPGDKMIHIRLPRVLHRRVRHRCVDQDVSIQSYVLALIERDMEVYQRSGKNDGEGR